MAIVIGLNSAGYNVGAILASIGQGCVFAYYISSEANTGNTQTEINLEILRQLNANKLEFAFPTQTFYTIDSTHA